MAIDTSRRTAIVGSGAGGLARAVRLAGNGEPHVLRIDRARTHARKPRLHEMEAGLKDSVDPVDYADIAETWGFSFQRGERDDIAPKDSKIQLPPIMDERDRECVAARTIAYDALVLAKDGVSPGTGVDGVLDHVLMLDSQTDAHRLFRHFSAGTSSQAHTSVSDGTNTPFRIVTVGFGATGLELAADRATAQSRSRFGAQITPARGRRHNSRERGYADARPGRCHA